MLRTPPRKPAWMQATWAFFSLHGVLVESAAIVPHTRFMHISTLPALQTSTNKNNRIAPSVEQDKDWAA